MRLFLYFCIVVSFFSCKNPNSFNDGVGKESIQVSKSIIDSIVNDTVATKDFREFKVLDSKYINLEDLWEPFNDELKNFTEQHYNDLKPLIIEQDIPTLQKHIREGKLTYEKLTKFYLYRIRKFDRENERSLNSVIDLNPKVIDEAKQKDRELKNKMLKRPIFGMPILLKDNINTSGMPTTAGAVALQNNNTEDAFIVKQLKSQGALILGKTNLSEWAYFFCGDCPSGYSAIGGQTFNPYGRRTMDTSGSSSGSGVAVAANFCVAAAGTETVSSILSPSGYNSVVGLKPTVGLLSRSGIIPISSTIDTPGPMTKNVVDNAIMLDAMFGEDKNDSKSILAMWETGFYLDGLKKSNVNGKRLGAFKNLTKDTLYTNAIFTLEKLGVEIIEIEDVTSNLIVEDVIQFLTIDMKKDLPTYLTAWGDSSIIVKSVKDIVTFNKLDSLNRMPYGQKLFEGIVADNTSKSKHGIIKANFKAKGKQFLDTLMDAKQLDGILSINGRYSMYAAAADYPALTVPMGYNRKGVPEGLTFIGKRLQEKFLLQWAYAYEQASKMRKPPKNYN